MGFINVKGKHAQPVGMFFGKEMQVSNFRKLLEYSVIELLLSSQYLVNSHLFLQFNGQGCFYDLQKAGGSPIFPYLYVVYIMMLSQGLV